VLVLEQFNFINDNGSSAGMSRQFRVQYSQDYMAQMAVDSEAYWTELQKCTDKELIGHVGSLWFGDPSLDSQEGGISAAEKTMDQLNIPYEKLANAKAIEALPAELIPMMF